MYGVGPDRWDSPRQLVAEGDLGELAACVRIHPVERGVFELEVIEVETGFIVACQDTEGLERVSDLPAGTAMTPRGVVKVGCDMDDPRVRVGEALEERCGEEKGSQMVHREGHLQAIGGRRSPVRPQTGVVDEQVDPRELGKGLGQLSDRIE